MDVGSENNKSDFKISVNDLKIGMFVTDLDCDWLDTPFMLQGMFVRTSSDIEQLRKHCRHVYILSVGGAKFGGDVDFDSGVLIGRKPVKYPVEGTLQNEFSRVKVISKSARYYVNDMLQRVRLGESINGEAAKELVEESVDSVIRHPDAITFATKIRGLDEYTAEHCMNVCLLSIVFGRKLGLRKQQLVNVGLCGLLHDAGKVRIPDDILNKPGPLTREEYDIMKRHTTYGMEVLSAKKDMYQQAIDVAYSHHERPDGSGYPRGLGAKDLSLYTKIVSIVDVFDAITGDRVYAKGRPATEALRILFEGRGKQFDNALTLAFIQTIGVYPPGTLVELVNGMVAIVVSTESGPRHLPKVLILRDAEKQPCEERVVNLHNSDDSKMDKRFFIKNVLPDGCYGISLGHYFDRDVFQHLQLD